MKQVDDGFEGGGGAGGSYTPPKPEPYKESKLGKYGWLVVALAIFILIAVAALPK